MKNGSYLGIVGAVAAAVVISSLFPGCREKEAVSNQTVVTAIGIEKQTNGYRLSVQAVDALKTAGSLSEQTESATAVYHASGGSVAQALQSFLNETGRRTYVLHNQIIGLGLTQCRDVSLYEQLDYFIRNLEGRSLVNVVLCRGDPSALLSIRSGNDAIQAEYIAQLLEEGAHAGFAYPARLLDVQRSMSGMYDTALPILSVKDGVVRLDGTAVFSQGLLKGELTPAQTTALLFASDEIDRCLFTEDGLTFRITKANSRLNIEQEDNGFSYRFSVSGTADIVEGGRSLTREDKQRLTVALSKRLEGLIRDTVSTVVKTYGCDLLGLARKTAKQYPAITQQQARAQLSTCKIIVTANIRLTESGFLT